MEIQRISLQSLKEVRLRWWVFLAILISMISFSLLYYLLTYVWPNPNTVFAAPQLLFFGVVFVGLSTAAVPVAAYLNHRFSKPERLQRDKTRLLRQSSWVGLIGALLAYLQLVRALNWAIAVVLVGIFVFIEMFFLTRD
ncbi:MAG TPA: hypothetical protein PKE64_01940 [Anaerolineae bacterium]|nr:hypothetical protein [Anaerolineae bacterium]HMR62747.1 hypothetical protein [Anaerolineae bacterium]